MNALTVKMPFKSLARSCWGVLASGMLMAGAHAAPTNLATQPFALSTNVPVLPNIMFVLDDSGSMQYDYLPDWAGPRFNLAVEQTLAHRFYNSSFNGVAYNPATRYQKPRMFTNTGVLDVTTYPDMTGQTTSAGGDGAATALLPNWRAVKVDGYGVQSAATSNLEGAAYFYTTIPGEYCTANDLRTCIASASATGSYTFAAPLRWCTTDPLSSDTTVNAGTSCQASNIEPATGITAYTFPRIPRPRTATITASIAGTVTGVTVGGVLNQILSASATGATSTDLAIDIAAKINACTYALTGACAVVGYSAKNLANVVTVTAPGAVTVSPAVTGGTTSVTAFSGGNVPGATLFTVITPTNNSYPYPGSATKATERIDCAGTTCTYAEEMTNYANWYAYYRTRMQMMKTSSSIAFSNVDDKFRVGYFSINNGSGSAFLNTSAFDGAQKNAWYTQFFAAVPYGTTPLRSGLANAGKYYAGKLSTLNGVAVTDPMQYSCQQNFTILSTDGYWNDSSNPTQLDGSTAIGQQDGNDPRPYYDGATQTRVETQTTRTDSQTGYNSKLVTKRTQQRQTTTQQVDKTVTTTTTYDYTKQISQLQKREKPLQQTRFNLTKVTTPLIQTPLILTEFTTKYSRSSRVLSSVSNKLRETTTPVREQERAITISSTKLKKTVTNITITETPLIRSTFLLTKTTRKLQKRTNDSYNGGDSYSWSLWADVTGGGATCVAGVITPTSFATGVLTKEIQCQYVIVSTDINQGTCTQVLQSAGPTYSEQAPVACAYQAATTATATGTFNDAVAKTTSGNNYVTAKSYAYGAAGAPVPNQTSCAPQAQGSGPYTGPARTCVWDLSPASAADATGPCTYNVPADASSPKTVCTYTGTVATPQTNQTTCTVVTGQTSTVNGTSYTTLDKVGCTRQTATSKAVTPSCTATGSAGAYATNPGSANGTVWSLSRTCTQDGTAVNVDSLDACTVATGVSGSTYTAKVDCSYAGGTPTTGTNLGANGCTAGTASSGTANGTVWNSYTSCTWGAPSTTGTNLSSCVQSGGQVGSVYSGPMVTCANQTPTSVANPSCVASTPATPFASPIITCSYVADTGNAITVSSCTPSATIACAYGTSATALNQASCKPQSQTPVLGVYYGPAVTCSYVNVGSTNPTTCNAVAQVADGTGTFPGPAYTCDATAAAWTGWTDVSSGSCSWSNPSTGPVNYTGPARECRYNPTSSDTNVGTCTAVPGSSGTNTGDLWTVLQKTVCVNDNPVEVVGPDTTTVDNCVVGTENTTPSTGIDVSVVTACGLQAASPVDSASCVASGGEAPAGTFNTKVTCSVADSGWVAVAPSCSPTTPASTFDAFGKIVECLETDLTVYPVEYPTGPVPVASCTAGTDSGTKVQTTCETAAMPLTKPAEPVASCAPASPGAPHYVTTTCTPLSTTTTTMGCDAQTASSPEWKTVTCTADGTGTFDTLADVAAYYYKTDLRTDALSNCTGAGPGTLCSATDAMNNVPTTAADPNSAQHMTTFTLGLGASGYMRYSPTYTTDTSGDFYTVKGVSPYFPANGIAADPGNGICSWQANGLCNWPVPQSAAQTTIDDLWHAGVNGHGAYFSATDPVSLSSSISTTLAQVASASAVAAAATVSNPVLTPGDSYIFSGTYKTVEWSGDVMRITLDPFSGLPAATVDWSAQSKLDAKAVSARNIYTFDSSVAVTKLKAFTSANYATNANFNSPNIDGLTQFGCVYADICLSATNQDSTHAAGANLVDYLRGDRTNEGAETDNNKYYRQRTHVLGDIVNAQVLYVNTPFYNYADPGYETFKTAQASRQAVAYAAANDGMLHAIAAKGSAATETLVLAAANAYAAAVLEPSNAAKVAAAATAATSATTALAADTVVGQELWAYIPSKVMPNMYRLADKKYQDKHRYYVDASPTVADICTSNCTDDATAVWKTILVGGLGRGGRAYYALDITDPANPKALWEFSDANLGYSYGPPKIAKKSDGTWVVLLTTGYNNIPNDDGTGGDGVGRLFVVNAATGAQIAGVSPLSTGVGDTTTPSGLSKITAPVISPSTDSTIVAVYGGDLLGNLWRFDINNEIGAAGVDAQLFAVLKDGTGKRQPITTRPIVSLVKKRYIVLVGTGQFLDTSDALATDQQSFYGLVDHFDNATTPSTAIYDNPGGAPRLSSAGLNSNGFIMQKLTEVNCPTGAPVYLCSTGEKVQTSSNVQVDFNVHNGWFIDLINSSERVNLDPALALGTLVFNTNAPSSVSCDLGGKSYQYWLDYKSGSAILAPGNPGIAGKKLGDSLVNAPSLYETPGGLRVGTQLPCVGPTCFRVDVPPVSNEASLTRRTSWRELIAE